MKQINKEEAIKRLDAIEKEQEELRAIIEAEEPKSVVYKPEMGEYYYMCLNDSNVVCHQWGNSIIDNLWYSQGRIRKTEEQANQLELAERIMFRLQCLADEANGKKMRHADWQGFNSYACACLPDDYELHVFECFEWASVNTNACFNVRESAEEALKTLISEFGEDNVQMALSGVWR
jgi:hypothetical protein